MKVIAALSILMAVFFGWRYRKLKRDVYAFSDRLEESLDGIAAGRPAIEESMEDTLFDKLNEKLGRVREIFESRGQENEKERQKLQELISDTAHQSRIPLANQRVYLEILEEEDLSPQGLAAVQSLKNQNSRLDFLLESMIKLSRLETGVLQIKKDEKDLMNTIRLALSPVVPLAAKKNIELHITGGESACVEHDGKWTAEAILNLLDNAVKYTNDNGRIWVSVRRREVFTEVCVRDSGKGIPLERQAQIFQRFYREPEVHAQEGIGIGLYLTRKIIELQNGYVDVVSRPGEGAAFCIHLPNGDT